MPLYTCDIPTKWGTKQLKVFHGDLRDLPEPADLLVCSAYWRGYYPSTSSLIGALWREFGVSVAELAENPAINMKDLGVWFTQKSRRHDGGRSGSLPDSPRKMI